MYYDNAPYKYTFYLLTYLLTYVGALRRESCKTLAPGWYAHPVDPKLLPVGRYYRAKFRRCGSNDIALKNLTPAAPTGWGAQNLTHRSRRKSINPEHLVQIHPQISMHIHKRARTWTVTVGYLPPSSGKINGSIYIYHYFFKGTERSLPFWMGQKILPV